jgi:hypothetical protein
MATPFMFTLVEKIELTQRVHELEAENRKLREDVERLKTNLQIAREQEAAYYRTRSSGKVLPADPSGIVVT